MSAQICLFSFEKFRILRFIIIIICFGSRKKFIHSGKNQIFIIDNSKKKIPQKPIGLKRAHRQRPTDYE